MMRPLFDSVNGRNVRMIQRGQHQGFASEARHAIGILSEGFRQNLDSDVAVELGVDGPPHLAHAALAELGGDPVMGNGAAGIHCA